MHEVGLAPYGILPMYEGGRIVPSSPFPSPCNTALLIQHHSCAFASPPSQWDFLTVAYCLSMETAVTAALFLDLYYWIIMVAIQVRGCAPGGA